MTRNIAQNLWMVVLFILLLSLTIWAICYVDKIENKISIFGIIALIVAAFTSVLTITINNKKVKEREYELHVLKEKQKVYDHFYNSFFEILNNSKKKNNGLSAKAINELMLFKQGLMNWGSEDLIKKYIEYDNKLTKISEPFDIINHGNEFLKEIRKDLGFNDSTNLNLVSIILNSEAREELTKN